MPLRVAPLTWSWKEGTVRVPRPALEAGLFDFLIDLDEANLTAHPDDLESLARLGELYTKRGRHADGLAIDRRLVEKMPESPTAHYNLACSLALTGERDGAFAALELAVSLGYDDADHLAADDDLKVLRDDPRYAALLARLRGMG